MYSKDMLLSLFKKIVLVGVVLVTISAVWIFAHYDARATAPADCIVVFGAAVWPGNRPSHALADRMLTAIDLYKNNYSNHCLILSGGPSTPPLRHEVDVMRDIALASGIPADALVTDDAGVRTRETLAHLEPHRSYILVSNDFHLGRIRLLAHRYDLHATVHASTYRHGRYIKEPFFVAREIVAFYYYLLHLDALRRQQDQ